MSSHLATILCLVFICYLFWMDKKESIGQSHALWIPVVWMFLAGSRTLSQWFALGTVIDPLEAYSEGSPLDRDIYLVLIIVGIIVLLLRKPDWNQLLSRNKWLWLYFAFCLFSILWSDESFVSFKRWVKALGTVVMVLIIMTDNRPNDALGTCMRRLSFLLIPLSVLFIRYYPEYGRSYHLHQVMYTGVAYSKNTLGQLCLLSGVYFSWCLLHRRGHELKTGGYRRIIIDVFFVAMTAWVLYYANSATSLACLIIVISFFAVGKMHVFVQKPNALLTTFIISLAFIGMLEYLFDLRNLIITALGRESDLTSRLPMWEMLLSWDINPWIGVGYESFWSGDRLLAIWQEWPWIIQAHNGYLDVYLNIGLTGLAMIMIAVAIGLTKAIKHTKYDHAAGMLKIALIITALLYNWTEAAIKPIGNMMMLLLIGILDLELNHNTKGSQSR